ncbi:uncharacterized protein BJ171DRAFT_483584 [Polychytrium aggregatum]|uniref:uncharacterized protein n=1 Tax=Polychytrium aggregatum TaxID=110093 RepID=UPI0022FEEC3F|nr:uncharacterized protein BJ171DRAFT_483584 [Polychytrium aggregatum]KAI9188495.1 hypothetical protein BJ171DRAFT_483584 [Polychytrium aggregatum]
MPQRSETLFHFTDYHDPMHHHDFEYISHRTIDPSDHPDKSHISLDHGNNVSLTYRIGDQRYTHILGKDIRNRNELVAHHPSPPFRVAMLVNKRSGASGTVSILSLMNELLGPNGDAHGQNYTLRDVFPYIMHRLGKLGNIRNYKIIAMDRTLNRFVYDDLERN